MSSGHEHGLVHRRHVGTQPDFVAAHDPRRLSVAFGAKQTSGYFDR
jgi:hypothetical protein